MKASARGPSIHFDAALRQRGDRSLSAVVLGFRLFALAAVSGTAIFLPRQRVSIAGVAALVVVATGLAALQHFLMARSWRRLAAGLTWLHVVSWTLLIHVTGGQGSPLMLGYLLELPLTGALFGRRGLLSAAVASILCYGLYASTWGGPLDPRTAGTWVAVLALCAAITWRVVSLLERQRAQIDARTTLADKAETLADELRLLGDVVADALVSIDACGRIERLNPAGLALLQVDSHSALGKPWQEVVRLDPASRVRLTETLDTGAAQHDLTVVLTVSGGSKVTVRGEMWREAGPSAERVHLLLAPCAPSSVDDPVRRLGESAACVAHQIRNSMHSIQGYVGTLGREPGARSQTADECLGALQGLGALADDVLALAGADRPLPERVAIQDVVRSALVLLGQPPVRLAVPDSPVYVEARRGPLVHAVFNLLDNAVQASPPGQAVCVRVERREQRVVLDIADEGPGIPAAVARAAGPVPSRRGAGLGLLAARRFVESCGGVLSLASGECGGTHCRLDLPAALAAPAHPTP